VAAVVAALSTGEYLCAAAHRIVYVVFNNLKLAFV